MKLKELQEACKVLNYNSSDVKAMLYEGRYDFRDKTTSLSYAHFSILVYAALVAGGVKDNELVPINLLQINITQFMAPIMKSIIDSRRPSIFEIKEVIKKNIAFNKRISAFLESKNNEDFIAVAVSDDLSPNASHGMRVHLQRHHHRFTIQIFDSAVGEGKKGDEAASESANFQWLSAYLVQFIKNVQPSATFKLSAKASPHQLSHLCYDHSAFALAEYVLTTMGKECHFIIPEEKGGQGQRIPLRENLYSCHEIQAVDLTHKIKPLVNYIATSVLKQGPITRVTDSASQIQKDAEMAQKLTQQFETDSKRVLEEHQRLTEQFASSNPQALLPAKGYRRLSDDKKPEDSNNSCCFCIIL